MQARLKKEMSMLQNDPPEGITCWPSNDNLLQWEAGLMGSPDTPYHGGFFRLKIVIPERY